MAAGSNWKLLAEQAKTFDADAVAIAEPDAAKELASILSEGTDMLVGPESMSDLIWQVEPDMVLTAVVGSAGLGPTLTAIKCEADLAIANNKLSVAKDCIVLEGKELGMFRDNIQLDANIAVVALTAVASAVYVGEESGQGPIDVTPMGSHESKNTDNETSVSPGTPKSNESGEGSEASVRRSLRRLLKEVEK